MKDFVAYELALELKELGFDEECIAHYDTDGLKILTYHWFPGNKNSSFPEPHTTNNPKISAPLYQQSFRWFREKYDLDSYVTQIELNGKSYWKVRKIETDDSVKGYSNFHDTFEESELECLKQLIKIVKNK